MPTSRRSVVAAALLSISGPAGCGLAPCACSSTTEYSAYSDGPGPSDHKNAGSDPSGFASPSAGGDAARALEEADVVQSDGGRLYALSKNGTLSVIDVSSPTHLVLMQQTALPGEPFELYKRGDELVVLSNFAVRDDGSILRHEAEAGAAEAQAPAATDKTGAMGAPAPAPTPEKGTGALVIALDARDAANIRTRSESPVAGEIADSRFLGDVLYLTTFENGTCYQCAGPTRTVLTSFHESAQEGLRRIDQLTFAGSAGGEGNAIDPTPWKRSVYATESRIYLGGLGEPGTPAAQAGSEGLIDVVDVRDPGGIMHALARVPVAGPVKSRWQMDERDGVLRVVSQYGSGRSENGEKPPVVETLRIDDTGTAQQLAAMPLRLPRQEGLRTVRFDGARAYAITFQRTDPLFVIDLADPAAPRQRGELEMPGWVFSIEPHGDRLLGLGVAAEGATGSGVLNLSLFDVSNADAPKLVTRRTFGPTSGMNGVTHLPEDQDRIQKAFRSFEDGLVVVPYAEESTTAYHGCTVQRGGAALFQWEQDALVPMGTLTPDDAPRRVLPLGEHYLATVGTTEVATFQRPRVQSGIDGQIQAQNTAEARSPISRVSLGECRTPTGDSQAQHGPSDSSYHREGDGYGYGDDYSCY